MQENSVGAFRAVIQKTRTNEEGVESSYKLHYGPYGRIGNAKAILTVELDHETRYAYGSTKVEGWIEHTGSQWERVEEK